MLCGCVPLTVGNAQNNRSHMDSNLHEDLWWTKTLCSLARGINLESFQTWTWAFIDAIAGLETLVVSLSLLHLLQNLFFLPSANEFQIIGRNTSKKDKGKNCLTTCDGTDFWSAEQGKAFYSHKFK